MDEELKTYLEEMKRELRGHTEAMEARLKLHVSEQCYGVETKLLTEFHKWGRTSDMRTRQAITDVGLLGERMLAVEDRNSALERGESEKSH